MLAVLPNYDKECWWRPATGRLRRQRRRINYVHHALQDRDNDSLMNIESLFQFLFKRGEFLSQLALVTEQSAHFQKGSDDPFDCAQGRLLLPSGPPVGCSVHLPP